jgi:phosphocarrier protein
MSVAESRKTVVIQNELGMHARAASQFVRLASTFPCQVSVIKDGQEVNGKSIMGVLMLVASQGTSIEIVARGERCDEAVQALVKLVNDLFGEGK